MRQRILLLYANTWTMTDDKTGEFKTGVSVNFYFNLTLDPVKNADGSIGMRSAKASMAVDRMKKCIQAPALYDAEFEMSVGSDGKPVMKIVDLDYISSVTVTEILKAEETAKKAG